MDDPRLKINPLETVPEMLSFVPVYRFRLDHNTVRRIDSPLEMPGFIHLMQYEITPWRVLRDEFYVGIKQCENFNEAWRYWREWTVYSLEDIAAQYRERVERMNAHATDMELFYDQIADMPKH